MSLTKILVPTVIILTIILSLQLTGVVHLVETSAEHALPTLGQPLASSTSSMGKIAFTSDRDGHSEIYTMNADGSNQTRLTNTGVNNSSQPTWSSW
jgi:hypothetical protein